MEWMCETEECLVDQNLLDNLVQSQNYLDWIPGNYSQFWGKTLQEGQNGRLGTDSTLVRKSNSILGNSYCRLSLKNYFYLFYDELGTIYILA